MLSRNLLGGAAMAAIGLAMTPPAIAQQTTSSVRGTIFSATGAPIEGATITVTHVPSGTRAVERTLPGGVFDVRGLRVGGPYTISVSAPSYTDEQLNGVMLTVGVPTRYDIALTPEAEAITVSAKVRTRLADPGSSTTIGRDEINTVTTMRRDIRDITRRDPLVTLDNVTRGTGPAGGIYIAGSTPRLNRITIDGVRSADDFGLNTGGLSTTRGPISMEAIEQLSVQAVPFDVAEGDFTGGAVNLVLRGGGNAFSGSAFVNYQNDGLFGEHVNGVRSSVPGQLQNYGGFLSGPIIKDKLFFAASYEYYRSLDPNAFQGPADLGFANLINGIGGSASGVPKLTTTDLAPVYTAWNSYATSSLLPIGTFPTATPTRDVKRSLRIDYNLTDNQRIQASYRHAESSLYKAFASATTASPNTNWYIQSELEDNYALQLNSNWTNSFSTEARAAFRSYVRGQNPPEGQGFGELTVCLDATASGDPYQCTNTNSQGSSSANPSPANTTPNGQPSLVWGPDQFRQANVLKTKNTSGHLTGNYDVGAHTIKAGAQYKKIEIFNVFVPKANGQYYFDSVADFVAGRAGRLQYQNNPGGDPTDAAADFAYTNNSVFAQDSWDISDTLTVNAGLRYDFYQMDDEPALNQRFVNRYGFSNQKTYDGLDVLMPRLSFKYDPQEWISIGGGIGLFSGGIPDVFISNRFSNTGVLTNAIDLQRRGTLGTATEACIDAGSNTFYSLATCDALLNINKADATFNVGVPAAATPLLAVDSPARRTAETNSLAQNFEMPSDWKGNLSFKLDAPSGWRFGVDIVASQSNEAVAFRDIRARPLTVNGVQQYTPDGRIRYDGLVISGASAAAIRSNRITAGLPTSAEDDLLNLGNSRDIQAYNPGETSWSRTLALSASKTFESINFDLSAALILQDASNFGTITEFATTDSGFYGDQFSAYDPNTSVKGRASNEIENQFKLSGTWTQNFFGELASRFTLFAESRAGRPFSFVMTDAAGSSRGPVFGVNRGDQLLYVPNVDAPDAGNPLKFVSPQGATVFFADAATLANFTSIVREWGLPANQITPKGYGDNPRINQVDFQFDQELPGFLSGHRTHLTFDVKNLLNLVNDNWGLVREYGDSRGGTGNRVVSVQCADASGTALDASNALSCPAYRYSSFNSGAGAVGSNAPNIDTSSRWYVQVGLKYQF